MGSVGNRDNIAVADTEDSLRISLEKARHTLLSGGIVGFPTESFYGLAVDIENEEAIERLFSIKKREKNKPLLIILPNLNSLERYAENVSDQALKLKEEFWPGGLTMLFKANPVVSTLLTAGTGKIGIRYSSHPLATSLAVSINRPVTGTSANISGHLPCTRAEEVHEYFGKTVDLILDAGRTKGGKGSTILDVTKEPPEILREGIVLKEEIERITGQ
ncbi:L-threonylcarbamoyladenylate synthase [Thermodesulfobacteriota bacterium]